LLIVVNTPAEIQRNQKLVDNNNQDYARIDKSKGEDFLFVNQQIDYAREMTECGKNKGGLLNSLLISANFSCLFLSYNFLYFLLILFLHLCPFLPHSQGQRSMFLGLSKRLKKI
jgi:hypothetical protein